MEDKSIGLWGITDMVRAQINIKDADQLKEAYQILKKMDRIQVVRVKNKLNTPLHQVAVNFILQQSIIGELQLQYGSTPPQYDANHFLYELARADSVA